jgi:O-antigen/teichoic acid export membrane protein
MTEHKEIKKLFSDYFAVLSGQVGMAVLGMLSLTLTARLLEPEGFGVLSLILMVTGFLSMLIINWPNAAIIRFGKQEYVETGNIRTTFWARMMLFAASAAVSVISLYFFQDRIAGYVRIESRYFYLLVLYVIVSSLADLSIYFYQAIGDMKRYSAIPFSGKLINFILLLFISLHWFAPTVINVLVVSIISQLGVCLLSALCLSRAYVLPPAADQGMLRNILRYSWSIPLGGLSSFVVGWIDLYFIKKYMTIPDLGNYSLAYRGFTFLVLIIMAVNNLMTPFIVTLRASQRVDLIRKYLDDMAGVLLFFWSLFIVGLIPLVTLLLPQVFGIRYNAATGSFIILSAALAYNAIGSLYASVTAAYDIIFEVIIINVITSVLNILADIWLIPVFGINGAALATALAIGLTSVLYMPLLKKYPELEYKGKRFMIVLMPLPVILMIVYSWLVKSWAWQAIAAGIIIVVSLQVGKRARLFSPNTLSLVERIDMPEMIKTNIRRMYSPLVKEGK